MSGWGGARRKAGAFRASSSGTVARGLIEVIETPLLRDVVYVDPPPAPAQNTNRAVDTAKEGSGAEIALRFLPYFRGLR